MSKRSAAASPSKRPAKRPRGIGAPSIDDQSLRLIAARLSAERAGHGSSYLSTRPDPSRNRVRSLLEISLRSAAKGLLEVVQVNKDDQPRAGADGNAKALFGWDPSRRQGAVREGPGPEELEALRDYVKGLPEAVANRLLAVVLESSGEGATASPDGIDIHRLAKLFLHSTTTILSLSALGLTQQLLNKLPDCTSLADLDLSSHTTLSDNTLKQILPKLSQLRRIVLRGCTKVGDGSVVALSRATEHRIKDVNLSMTAVTIKGLTSLLARCSALEVLKLANVPGLNEKNITKLVDESTSAAIGFRHIPLSCLHTLKLRSTDITDSSLGRLLALCSLSLIRLDISYTSVKNLDILTHALGAAPEWRLEKLVASGLPLSPATLVGFFAPLAVRPEEERARFTTLKLAAIPDSGTKAPGLTDEVLAKILPHLETLGGLVYVSFSHNWALGRHEQPMGRFIEVIGRRCITLDLTCGINSYHLDGLLPPLNGDAFQPPRIQHLVLDQTKITDEAAPAISECKDLRALHLAETKISTLLLIQVMKSCPLLSTLNLTSCRGVKVGQRRAFFEAFENGEVDLEE